MTSLFHAERMLTQLDVARLSRRLQSDRLSALVDCLEEAAVVEPTEIPHDVITMNSLFTVRDQQSGETRNLKLCYPEGADLTQGWISVFSPAGASFLGLRMGETAIWLSPQGQEHRALVTQVLFQPEASGDYTL